jgi:hypothetical protein
LESLWKAPWVFGRFFFAPAVLFRTSWFSIFYLCAWVLELKRDTLRLKCLAIVTTGQWVLAYVRAMLLWYDTSNPRTLSPAGD